MEPKENTEAATWFDVNKLSPWDKNPRINDHVIDRVMESIRGFGFGAPIVARKEDSRIIAGHTRLLAAKELGMKFVPVRFLDISEADAKLYALADNKLSEYARWDDPGLAEVLAELTEEDGMTLEDLGATGFGEPELMALLGQTADKDAPERFEDFDAGGLEMEHTCPKCGYEW